MELLSPPYFLLIGWSLQTEALLNRRWVGSELRAWDEHFENIPPEWRHNKVYQNHEWEKIRNRGFRAACSLSLPVHVLISLPETLVMFIWVSTIVMLYIWKKIRSQVGWYSTQHVLRRCCTLICCCEWIDISTISNNPSDIWLADNEGLMPKLDLCTVSDFHYGTNSSSSHWVLSPS